MLNCNYTVDILSHTVTLFHLEVTLKNLINGYFKQIMPRSSCKTDKLKQTIDWNQAWLKTSKIMTNFRVNIKFHYTKAPTKLWWKLCWWSEGSVSRSWFRSRRILLRNWVYFRIRITISVSGSEGSNPGSMYLQILKICFRIPKISFWIRRADSFLRVPRICFRIRGLFF
jgi:hypothetical protein